MSIPWGVDDVLSSQQREAANDLFQQFRPEMLMLETQKLDQIFRKVCSFQWVTVSHMSNEVDQVPEKDDAHVRG